MVTRFTFEWTDMFLIFRKAKLQKQIVLFLKEKGKLKVTILGSGTSQGVPVIACDCYVCISEDPKDNRLRCSILLSEGDKNFVIDSGPDFRQQMLRANVQSLEAIIFTHHHKDHVAGLDDVRAFNFKQKMDMPIYCDFAVEEALRREFQYVFEANSYPGIPKVDIIHIDKNQSFKIAEDIELIPIEVMHHKMLVLGFRYKKFTYITDANFISEEEKQKIKGTEILIVNALRKTEHVSHFNLQQALDFIAEINPTQAYLTHISHLMGTHEETLKELPPNVSVAYDGMSIEL